MNIQQVHTCEDDEKESRMEDQNFQTHGMRVHIQPNGLRRKGSNEDLSFICVVLLVYLKNIGNGIATQVK